MFLGFKRFYSWDQSFETSNISNVVLFDDLGFWKIKKQHTFTIFSEIQTCFSVYIIFWTNFCTERTVSYKTWSLTRHKFCI